MRTEKWLIVILIMIVTGSLSAQGWQLVWQDEFDTEISDDWFLETGYGGWGWGNDEWQYYQPENAFVRDSCLVIRAEVDGEPGKRDRSITSARMKTQDRYEFNYGKIEARIKLDRGKGLWPAFWMLGSNMSWPDCGEIDIMENINGESTIHGTAHWVSGGQLASYGQSVRNVDIEAFHTYTVIWDQQYIRWEFDGQEYNRLSITGASLSEFHQPFYIILNMAVGGQWPGPPDSTSLPAEMHVDYVRVYMNKGPRLGLQPYELNFALSGGGSASVEPQTVTLVNTGSDTLQNVTVSSDADWIDVIWNDHEGNEQFFDVALNSQADALSLGTYSTLLIVQADDAPSDTVSVDLQVGTNIVLNNIAKASSVSKDASGDETISARNVNDGDMQSRWVSEAGAEQWVSLDLNKLFINKFYTVSTVNVCWDEAYAGEYEIQVANTSDFSDYAVIAEVTDGDGGVDRLSTDASVAGKYLRLYAKAGGEESGYGIYELQVFGKVSTGVEQRQAHVPDQFRLTNAPNPFNPVTTISFTLPAKQRVDLALYDMTGRRVATLVSEERDAGTYQIDWNAGNRSSGLYICRLTTPGMSVTRKLVLLK
ncbi:MAG: family 16 glycosylhydrolase [candidate division KSB1 bacterium]|nr:family 16 glycosylhydrolase [candidate division KSB1 bacterium]